ncbi:CASP-like protein 1E1 [Euphorbia lathyris]|uniref:CASP-like protein 1E1 n=1 Tax=Euphorbia lathyris TaxID=212925 RepID=UPI003314339B
MDSQTKGSFGGVERKSEMEGGSGRGSKLGFMSLRVLGMVLTLTAAITLGVNKQTKVVPIKLVESLPPLYVPVVAKSHYLSAFMFFVVTNAIASAYAAISLVISIAGKKNMAIIITMLDLLMVALLFSSNGAAAAIGLMGYQGNSHVRWNKVCNVFGKFCHQVAASLVISLLGSIVFFLLVLLSALRLHSNKSL